MSKERKTPRFVLKEWQRTVLLVALIAFAIGFIIWTKQQYESNFVETF